ALYHFATHPEQRAAILADPSLIPTGVDAGSVGHGHRTRVGQPAGGPSRCVSLRSAHACGVWAR
ncbi:hypothetical protein, partial [Streptomyces sp. NPDC002172]